MAEKISANRTVSPNEAKKSIRKCIKIKRPVFLWGPPGIGKSEIVQQVGEEQGREVIDVRLSLWEPTDVKGIPYFNSKLGTMCWAPPVELPTDPDSTAILFLDELNSAAPATQAAAYQLILNRRVGTYKLPDGVSIVAAGNRETDKGVTYRMPMPLANRFIHLEMRPDFTSWQTWAVNKNIHKDVVGYLSFAKNDLYDFDSKSSSRAFATPRSWCFVSDLLNDEDIDSDTQFNLVAGAVGEGLAVKFMAHRKIAGKMPEPTEILNGKVKDLAIKEISAMYALTIAMCYELKDAIDNKKITSKEFHGMAENFFTYMMNNFETELVVMGAKIALKTYKLPIEPTQLKNFDEFHKKYGKYIVEAGQ